MVLLPLLLLVLRIQSASANLATDDLWTLTFSDEFEDAATAVINGAKSDCFNRVPICMPKDGEVRKCPEYKDQLKDLNKCNWNVYDYANYMGDDPVTSAAFQSFKPKEVSVKDGQNDEMHLHRQVSFQNRQKLRHATF